MNRNSLQRFALVVLLAAIAVILGPSTVYAHSGVGPAHDLLHGLAHPLTGLDHVLAMFAVGLWAAQRGGRAIWFVPLTFVLVMTLGATLGMSGVSIPFVESGIAISVLVLGVFVAAAVRLPLSISAAIVGLFALLHGHAHGAEIPASATGMTYVVGFILATVFLHAAGISVGIIAQRLHSSPRIVRYAGAAIAACGLFLCVR
jgi:urease accessory protein